MKQLVDQDYDHIFLEIGTIGHFSAHDCSKAAGAFLLARKQFPRATVGFFVGGYDDDPREIYDIPEARSYIRQWAQFAGLADWREAIRLPWEPAHCLGILQLCGVFAADSPIAVNTPVGVRK